MLDYQQELATAVKHFWMTRGRQKKQQGTRSGMKDAGNRASVTGGKHGDGFIRLIAAIINDAGLPRAEIHIAEKRPRTLPGFYRPCKEWDLVVLSGSDLVAVVEVKSQIGSFGNNFNNRVEEAIGNAADFWAAYREGMFKPSLRPWLGYLFMLEACEASLRATNPIHLSPYAVDSAFQRTSYVERYGLACQRLVRDRHYDAACFFTSSADSGKQGRYVEPNPELSIKAFAVSLHARSAALAQMGQDVTVLDTKNSE